MNLLAVAAASALLTSSPAPAQITDVALQARIARLLARQPVIDGHNDLPWALRERWGRELWAQDISGAAGPVTAFQTDLARLKRGGVGAQLWSVWIPATLSGDEAVRTTIEQIDIVHGLEARYSDRLAAAATADDVARIQRSGRIASLIGVEGWQQTGDSLAVLRQFHRLSVRYVTLTHSRTNAVADSATDAPRHNGLSLFGRTVVAEMNRLGMLVDLSHVSAETMRQAIALSRAPVIFSHSNARALADHPRNVPDDVLRLVRERGGVVMVNFYPGFLSPDYRRWSIAHAAEVARLNAVHLGAPDQARAAQAAWDAANPKPAVPLSLVADHIEHVAKLAGPEGVGIGSDFDGIDGEAPVGLPGVDAYPALLAELARRGWTDEQLARLTGGNFLRVLRAAEQVAETMKSAPLANPAPGS